MTVTLLDTDALVEAFVWKLRQGMPDRVQKINQQSQDDCVLAAPDEALYFTGRVRELPQTPAIFVMEGRTQYREEGSHGLNSVVEVFVHILESDQDGPRLNRRLRRQKKAVIETLWDDEPREKLIHPHTGQTVAHHLKPVRTLPGPTTEPAGVDGWRSFYVVVFRALMIEE